MADSIASLVPGYRCPGCGYDLGRLPVQRNARCPECGHTLVLDGADDARFELIQEALDRWQIITIITSFGLVIMGGLSILAVVAAGWMLPLLILVWPHIAVLLIAASRRSDIKTWKFGDMPGERTISRRAAVLGTILTFAYLYAVMLVVAAAILCYAIAIRP